MPGLCPSPNTGQLNVMPPCSYEQLHESVVDVTGHQEYATGDWETYINTVQARGSHFIVVIQHN